jgi:hypothetical protein
MQSSVTRLHVLGARFWLALGYPICMGAAPKGLVLGIMAPILVSWLVKFRPSLS